MIDNDMMDREIRRTSVGLTPWSDYLRPAFWGSAAYLAAIAFADASVLEAILSFWAVSAASDATLLRIRHNRLVAQLMMKGFDIKPL
jgi:hypothetical protein